MNKKQWPKVGSKVAFKGTRMFFFKNMIEDANKLLEVDKEYTISKIKLASSWCGVILEEFPDNKFALNWFTYDKDLTTDEVLKTEKKELWDKAVYEFTSLEELKNKTKKYSE